MLAGRDGVLDAQTVAELFECGYALARDGYPWATKPPGVHQFNPPPPSEPPDTNLGRNHDGQTPE